MGRCRVEGSRRHPACALSPSGQTASADAHEGTWQEVTLARVSAWPRSREEPPPLTPWKREGAAPQKREGAARLACKSLLYGFTVRGGVGIRMCPRERAFLGVPTPASGGELGLHGGGGARGTRSLVLGSLGSLQFIQRGPGGPLP